MPMILITSKIIGSLIYTITISLQVFTKENRFQSPIKLSQIIYTEK